MRARMVPLGGTKMIFQMTPKTKVLTMAYEKRN
jgi:hypothetical protein